LLLLLLLLQVLAGLPDDQRAAVLAARAEGALGLQDGEDDLDEVSRGVNFTVAGRVKFMGLQSGQVQCSQPGLRGLWGCRTGKMTWMR
jgi:hypothetical protein